MAVSPEQLFKATHDTIVEFFDSSPVNRDGKPLEFVFEIREGRDGEDECHRCEILAPNAHHALILAHCRGFITSPWGTMIARDIEGDTANAHIVNCVKPVFGDACLWSASASLCIDSRNLHGRAVKTN